MAMNHVAGACLHQRRPPATPAHQADQRGMKLKHHVRLQGAKPNRGLEMHPLRHALDLPPGMGDTVPHFSFCPYSSLIPSSSAPLWTRPQISTPFSFDYIEVSLLIHDGGIRGYQSNVVNASQVL